VYKSSVPFILGFILLIRILFSANAQNSPAPGPPAGTFVVFAAEDYIRATGAPVAETRTFTILNPTAPYKLRVYNGGRNSQFGRIASVVIALNGREIVGTSDLNMDVVFIEREAPLLANNSFTVQLNSQPGSGISIEFAGIDNDLPQITASVNPPPNATGWNNTNVTVSFACVDAISGIASCSAPVVVSAEAAGQVVTGTATDRAGNVTTNSVTINLDKTGPSLTFGSATPVRQCRGLA
jgi:hypothetical protein